MGVAAQNRARNSPCEPISRSVDVVSGWTPGAPFLLGPTTYQASTREITYKGSITDATSKSLGRQARLTIVAPDSDLSQPDDFSKATFTITETLTSKGTQAIGRAKVSILQETGLYNWLIPALHDGSSSHSCDITGLRGHTLYDVTFSVQGQAEPEKSSIPECNKATDDDLSKAKWDQPVSTDFTGIYTAHYKQKGEVDRDDRKASVGNQDIYSYHMVYPSPVESVIQFNIIRMGKDKTKPSPRTLATIKTTETGMPAISFVLPGGFGKQYKCRTGYSNHQQFLDTLIYRSEIV